MLKDILDMRLPECFVTELHSCFLSNVTIQQPDPSPAVASCQRWRFCVCPASVTHLSGQNVPLISTTSRRLSDSSWATVKRPAGGGAGVTGSQGLDSVSQLLDGGLDKCGPPPLPPLSCPDTSRTSGAKFLWRDRPLIGKLSSTRITKYQLLSGVHRGGWACKALWEGGGGGGDQAAVQPC